MTRHQPRKRFGQHFLTDPAAIDQMVRAIAPEKTDAVVEIGPGLGALTLPLLARLGQMVVIELDRDLAQRWQRREGLQVVQADVLQVDFTELAGEHGNPGLRVVGNLPYNISTPILFHLLTHVSVIRDQHVMLQKEVVDRMVAQPCTASYGRLSVMLQWRYDMEALMHLGPEVFDPPPRVDSAVVRMQPRSNPASLDPKRLSALVQVAFSQRRKLLRHTLGPWLAQQSFSGEFDLQRRAEEVPVAQYLSLASAC